MVLLLEKGSNKQSPRNIILGAVANGTVQKRTVIPLQEMKHEYMMVLQKNKAKLVNQDTTSRRNPDFTSGIFITSVKLAQCTLVAENSTEK